MTLLLLAAITALRLLTADAALGRPDRLGCHATVGECLAVRFTLGRVVLTVAVAAAVPLFGLASSSRSPRRRAPISRRRWPPDHPDTREEPSTMTGPEQPSSKMSTADVAAKVDWEGGLVETMCCYGLPASEIADQHLAELWETAKTAFDTHVRPVLEGIERLLDDAAREADR
jgi:hypothetical protein